MQRAIVLDLVGEPGWQPAARRAGGLYLPLVGEPFWHPSARAPLVIDCRGRYADGIELLARLCMPPSEGALARRVLVTERIVAADHQRAYLAGVDQIFVAERGRVDHDAIIDAVCRSDGS